MTRSRRMPSPDEQEIVATIAFELQRTLAMRSVACGTVDRQGDLRFLAGAPDGAKMPRGIVDLEAHPDLAAAVHGREVTQLSGRTAALFGGERAIAVPWRAGGTSLGVCVLVASRDEDADEPASPDMLGMFGRQVAAALTAVKARDEMAERVEDLEQTASAFRMLVETTAEAVKLLDLDGRVRVWNGACEALYGWTAAEALGTILPHVPAGERTHVIADLRRTASAGDPADVEVVSQRKDGSRLMLRGTWIPMHDARGYPVGVLSFVRTVMADSDLERMKGDFVSLVSQEMKNPITAILGFTQLLSRPEIWEDAVKRTRTVRALEARAQQMATLIDDLLLASRIEQGELRLDHESTDLASLVTDTVSRFEQVQRSHRFVMDVDSRLPRVDVDRRRIEQVVSSLLSNAVKYSPDSAEVRVTAARDGDDAVLSVTDRGVGLGADDLPRVWDRFFQADSGSSRMYPGSGLGLYLVKMVAEAHGGTAHAESVPGEGSVFSVRLPLDH
jgi:PAS domain S-box-containing protein